jgi:hypothetical protein
VRGGVSAPLFYSIHLAAYDPEEIVRGTSTKVSDRGVATHSHRARALLRKCFRMLAAAAVARAKRTSSSLPAESQ